MKIKNRFFFIIFLLFFLLIINGNLISSESSEYSEIWFKFYYTAQKGDTSDAIKIIDELSNAKIKKNYKIEVLYLIWNYSLDLIKDGNYKEGIAYLEKLSNKFKKNWKLSDDIAALKIKHYDLIGGLKNNFKELVNISKNDFILIFSPLIKSILLSLLLSFIIFILYNYIENFKLIFNDVGGNSPYTLLFIMFLLLTPIFYLGIFYIPFGLAGIVIFYFSKKEKNLLLIFYISFFLIFIVYEVSTLLDSIVDNPSYQTIIRLNSGLYQDGELKKAESLYYKNRDEQLGMVIALTYYNDNKLFDAKKILEKMNKNSNTDEIRYLLLGNIYYKVGFFSLARDMYNKALLLNPNDPILNHNLGILLIKINQIESAQKFLKIARDKGVEKEDEIIMKIPYPNLNYFKYTNFKIDTKIFYNPLLLGILITLAFMIITKLLFRKIGESVKCEFCGKPYKRNNRISKRDYCEECFNLFVIKDPLLVETRKIKYKEIDNKNKKKTSKLLYFSLLIPGLDLLEKKYVYIYFIFSSLFYMFIFSGIILYENFRKIKFSNISGIYFISVFSGLIIYFIMNLIIYFIEKREWL